MQPSRHTVQVIAATAASLAAAQVAFPALQDRVNPTSLTLFALAALVLLIPWGRLSSFKAAGVEITVDAPQVSAAVDAIDLDRVESEHLRRKIETLSPLLPRIRGARVLWIDDEPQQILGERRLLRALGVSIVPAGSSEKAREILANDVDFDLIISDVQRSGAGYIETGGIPIHEGVNFIVQLRQTSNPAVRELPVIFYAAYDWDRLRRFTQPARESRPEPSITNAIDDLVTETIRQLADSRTDPIKVSAKKAPTELFHEGGS